MRSFLISNFWFTVIVTCEVLKWVAALQLTRHIGWLRPFVGH